MRRFYVDLDITDNNTVWLDKEESRHVIKVTRLKEGESLLVFDNAGKEFEAKIKTIEQGHKVEVEIIKEIDQPKRKFELFVAQAFLQKQKLDTMIEKACELGVQGVYPMVSEFSAARPKQVQFEKMESRWRRIITQAKKQSGNIRGVQIRPMSSFEGVINNADEFDFKFIFHQVEPGISLSEAISHMQKQVSSVEGKCKALVLIGAEGGFSDREVEQALEKQFAAVYLGETVLRAETAFIAISSAIKLMVND